MKHASPTRFTLQTDLAAHDPRQATADGKTQAGSGKVVLCLAEFFEDGLLLLGRDAGAGVVDRDAELSIDSHPRSRRGPRLQR